MIVREQDSESHTSRLGSELRMLRTLVFFFCTLDQQLKLLVEMTEDYRSWLYARLGLTFNGEMRLRNGELIFPLL